MHHACLQTVEHKTDLCVIGGGLAGMGATIQAARQGIKVLLMQERPVPGGNASGEIRMWICGCQNYQETGLVEELRLENLHRNPQGNWSIWDSILYEKVRFQENLTVLFNCSCCDAECDEQSRKILNVTGWQMTTQQFHRVTAEIFMDCSGDSILAPLTGAKHHFGREGKGTYGESLAPDHADAKTMGLSCLAQLREYDHPVKYIPPSWAQFYPKEEDFPPGRGHNIDAMQNFWWVELGGEQNSIADTESVKDEVLSSMAGVLDHIKNRGDHKAGNWGVDWIGFLPGKRESRRYEGLVTVTQTEILNGGNWPDAIAYGGWPVDDHHPAGIRHRGEPNTNIVPQQPYTLPLRALCSVNVPNLMFAGRNISVSHVALSSTRVMATCMQLGQAGGACAALAIQQKRLPGDIAREHYADVQKRLLADDVTILGLKHEPSALTREATIRSNRPHAEMLRSGRNRARDEKELQSFWRGETGAYVEYELDAIQEIHGVRLVLDSGLLKRSANRRDRNLPSQYPLNAPEKSLPDELLRNFDLEIDGKSILTIRDNHQRFLHFDLQNCQGKKIILRPLDSTPKTIFAFEVE
ncbi:MAG: FAD-dependent oxidoreductase [Lentisphaeria bacterium]|nr:FAD-dependent oxidoreductase [Lentisphaeria bacterium]